MTPTHPAINPPTWADAQAAWKDGTTPFVWVAGDLSIIRLEPTSRGYRKPYDLDVIAIAMPSGAVVLSPAVTVERVRHKLIPGAEGWCSGKWVKTDVISGLWTANNRFRLPLPGGPTIEIK